MDGRDACTRMLVLKARELSRQQWPKWRGFTYIIIYSEKLKLEPSVVALASTPVTGEVEAEES